jgi:peptide subunit release factor RF-3
VGAKSAGFILKPPAVQLKFPDPDATNFDPVIKQGRKIITRKNYEANHTQERASTTCQANQQSLRNQQIKLAQINSQQAEFRLVKEVSCQKPNNQFTEGQVTKIKH